MDSEWIEHDGKGLPPDLTPETVVRVKFPDGEESLFDLTVGFWGVNWRHSHPLHFADIVAYKVVK